MDKKLEARAIHKPSLKTIIIIAVLIALVTLPAWGSMYLVNIFILIMLYISIGHMWNLLAGYSGLVSLGQQAFVGIGGYCLALTSQEYGLPLIVGFVLAGVVSVIFALVISAPIFKMSGVYFTIGTWIVCECLRVFFSSWKFVNYSIGYNISATYKMMPSTIYFVALGIGVATTVLVIVLLRSKFGLGLMAMRDNSSSAEIRGIELYKTKLKCFLISSFVTGIAGAGLYLNIAFIQPNAAFGIDWTISMTFLVIIGGLGTIEGPLVGAVIFVLLRQLLYDFPGFSMLLLGIIAIAIILVAPKGIMGYVNERFGLDIFNIRRRLD